MRRIFDVPGSAGGGTRILDDARVCLDHDHPADDVRAGFLVRERLSSRRSCACSKSLTNAFSPARPGRSIRNGLGEVEGPGRLQGSLARSGACRRKSPRMGKVKANARHRWLPPFRASRVGRGGSAGPPAARETARALDPAKPRTRGPTIF